MLIFLLGIASLTSGVLGENGGQYVCDWGAINACKQTFELAHPDSPFAVYDESGMVQYCSDFEEYASCLEPYYRRCDPSSSPVAVYIGQLEAIDFVCGDGRDIYLDNVDCIGSEVVAAKLESCNATLFETIEQLKLGRHMLNSEDIRHLKGQFSEAVDLAVACTSNAGATLCNEEVRDWMKEISMALLTPLQKLLGYYGGDGDHHRHARDDDDSTERDDDDDSTDDDDDDDDDCDESSESCEDHDKDDVPIAVIVGVVVGVLFFVGLTIACLLICAKRLALIRAQKAVAAAPDKKPATTHVSTTAVPYVGNNKSTLDASSAPPEYTSVHMVDKPATTDGSTTAMPYVGNNKSKLPPVENEPSAPPEYIGGRMVAPPPYTTLPPISYTGAASPI